MGYSIQNSETGEVIYMPSDGAAKVETMSYDAETGEPIIGKFKVRYLKQKNFHIPKGIWRGTACEEFEKEMLGRTDEIYQEPRATITKNEPETSTIIEEKRWKKSKEKKGKYDRDAFINMNGVSNDIILGYKKSNYRILLFPTLFCFNIYAALIVMILEIFFHCWSHFKNGINDNKDVFYRSPLHVITSQFCAKCRSESDMEANIYRYLNKKMRTARESQTLKDVSKAIG